MHYSNSNKEISTILRFWHLLFHVDYKRMIYYMNMSLSATLRTLNDARSHIALLRIISVALRPSLQLNSRVFITF